MCSSYSNYSVVDGIYIPFQGGYDQRVRCTMVCTNQDLRYGFAVIDNDVYACWVHPVPSNPAGDRMTAHPRGQACGLNQTRMPTTTISDRDFFALFQGGDIMEEAADRVIAQLIAVERDLLDGLEMA
jgi:hypothetical protein